MARTSDQVKADIRQIDRRIDGVRTELYRRSNARLFCAFKAHDWQLAWDRNPDLRALDAGLFSLRGALMDERDAALELEYRAEQRRTRAKYRRAA